MATSQNRSWGHHTITVCTTCRNEGQADAPGRELIKRLQQKTTLAGRRGLPETYFVTGIDCMAGCPRPCTVAFQAGGKATYLFGDIDPAQDIEALVAFAKQYACSADGWTRSAERPPELAGKTLARVPAMTAVATAPADARP